MSTHAERYRLILRPKQGDQMFDFVELVTRDPREEIHIPCSTGRNAKRIAARAAMVAPEREIRIRVTEVCTYVVIERVQHG